MNLDDWTLAFKMLTCHAKVSGMKKVLLRLLSLSLAFSSISPSDSNKTEPYKNQETG